MSSSLLPTSAIPMPLPDDGDDVTWALQTAAVQWGRGAYQDAIVWLRRAAESAIDLEAWSRGADLNAAAVKLEKQLPRLQTQPSPPFSAPSGVPTSPQRNGILPPFPIPATSAPPPGSLGLPAGARRPTAGFSSLPPLPKPSPSSLAPSLPSPSSSNNVVIDVEEVEDDELELSDDEIRELESTALPISDIPDGALPAWSSPVPSMNASPAGAAHDSLPAYPLEPETSRPPGSPTSRRFPSPPGAGQQAQASQHVGMPASPRETMPRAGGAGASSAFPGRSTGVPVASTAPSATASAGFTQGSAVGGPPPMPKRNRQAGSGTSLPPPSSAPVSPSSTFESVPSVPVSRPYADDADDDGTPGLDVHVLDEEALAAIERHKPKTQQAPSVVAPPVERARASDLSLRPQQRRAESRQDEPVTTKLDRHMLESAMRANKAAAGPLGRLPVPPMRPSRTPSSVLPLPPALPDDRVGPRGRVGSGPSGALVGPTPADRQSPALAASARGPGPSVQDPLEPRMPPRSLSYSPPLDSSAAAERAPEARASTVPSPGMASNRADVDAAPTLEQIEAAEPISFAPPASSRSAAPSVSARSVEPEDLPTVSSPSLSRSPLEPLPHDSGPSSIDGLGERLSERLSEARVSDARGISLVAQERRRISFKFEERNDVEPQRVEPSEQPGSGAPSVVPRETMPAASAHDIPPLIDSAGASERLVEEPLAILPPVTTRPSAEPRDPSADDVVLSGVRLADVRGFSDLPASAHHMLAKTAHIEMLASGEEVSFFSVALVLDGWVGLMPAIADTACATAVVGEVVFTEGTLADGLMLRVVAGQDNVAVATWDSAAIIEATKECPWIADDLRLLADGFQALAGACLGPLGDRLDDSLRSIVTSRCEIRTLLPGEQLCAAGKPVPGMHIIGGGEIELVDAEGCVRKTHGTGEFLFAAQVLAGGLVPYAARAGKKGALVLFAPRMAAHELLVSVPPLLEILAE
jgi:hypothetical protein